MKDVLLSNAGVQVYIIDGSRRTDAAARAVITALYNAGRVCKEAAERAWSDRATLDKIKRNMLHVQMEERETETGKRWTFYTAGFVYMDIPAYSRNYITADKNGNLYPAEAHTETEITEGKEDTTTTETEPQRATEDAQTESRHKYGMRLRGYSIGAQPAGVVERADDPTGLYYDIITYNRELTPEELDMYSLTPLNAPTSTENAPQEPETNKAGETTTGAEKDAQRATQRAADLANTPEAWEEIPERTETAAPAYIVQCRSKRRPWTDYSSPATLEECKQIKERAEARHVLNQNGEPIMYRIATAPSTTGEHTTQTAHSAPEQTETAEAEHVPTATKTEPPRATDASTTGRADRTTGADTTPPRHTCENAPGRTERATAEQVHTAHTKSPPRAAQRATTHGRPRATPKKPRILADFTLYWTFPERFSQIFRGYPFRYVFSGRFLIRNFGAQNRTPPGGIKISCNPRRKNFQKIFLDGGKYNGTLHNTHN